MDEYPSYGPSGQAPQPAPYPPPYPYEREAPSDPWPAGQFLPEPQVRTGYGQPFVDDSPTLPSGVGYGFDGRDVQPSVWPDAAWSQPAHTSLPRAGSRPQPRRGARFSGGAVVRTVTAMLSAAGAVILLIVVASHAGALSTRGGSQAIDFTDALKAGVNGWSSSAHCYFSGSAYHANPSNATGGVLCFAPVGALGNFDMRVSAEELSGPAAYGYGLAFRHAGPGDFYIFVVDGAHHAWFGKFANGDGQRLSRLWSLPPSVRSTNTWITLRVVASGPTFTFYVNGWQVGSASDSTYTTGTVGVFSGDTGLDAAFADFSVQGTP